MHKIFMLVAVALMAIALAVYNFSLSFSPWKDPSYISDIVASDFGYYLSENLINEGVFYPNDDLDDPLLDQRKIVISHGMNENTSKDVVRKLLYLNGLDSHAPIDFYVSTQGGWYDSTFTIIDTFNVIDAPVNTICIGGCYSAGLLIMASGTGERIAYSNAHFSAHIFYGKSDDERPFAQQKDRVNAYLKSVAQLPEDWFPLDNNRHYYFTAEDALEYGVVDRVGKRKK